MKHKLLYSAIILVIITVAFFFYIFNSSPKIFSPTNIDKTASSTDVTNLNTYIEITNSCDFNFVGDCVNVRSGPGEQYPVVFRLRNNIVLLVADTVTENGRTWYKIGFASPLLYPERVGDDWYVAADLVTAFKDSGDHLLTAETSTTTSKRIVVDISEQKLYAYDGDDLFMEESVSTGLRLTPTPKGIFTIFKKTPSRFMQGPLPGVSAQEYDLPGVPWDLYFTEDGAVIHGAYWHESFAQRWSHGCVNLSPEHARKLYMWADVGVSVTVRE